MLELWDWINKNYHIDRIFYGILIIYCWIQIIYILPGKISKLEKEIAELKKSK